MMAHIMIFTLISVLSCFFIFNVQIAAYQQTLGAIVYDLIEEDRDRHIVSKS